MVTITVYPLLSPRIIEVDILYTAITIQELVDLAREWEDTSYGQDFPYLIDAAGKESLGGAVSVGITATLQNAKIKFAARTTPLDSGTITATDAAGRTMTDSTAQFVTDGNIYIGATIFNDTTNELESITDFDETTISSEPLSGQSSSGWTSGDAYIVFPNVVCTISGGNLVAVNDSGSPIAAITPSPNVQVQLEKSTSAALIDGGAASNPWSALTADNKIAGSFGELVGTTFLKILKFLKIK